MLCIIIIIIIIIISITLQKLGCENLISYTHQNHYKWPIFVALPKNAGKD
jgi:hypothetical protein